MSSAAALRTLGLFVYAICRRKQGDVIKPPPSSRWGGALVPGTWQPRSGRPPWNGTRLISTGPGLGFLSEAVAMTPAQPVALRSRRLRAKPGRPQTLSVGVRSVPRRLRPIKPAHGVRCDYAHGQGKILVRAVNRRVAIASLTYCCRNTECRWSCSAGRGLELEQLAGPNGIRSATRHRCRPVACRGLR